MAVITKEMIYDGESVVRSISLIDSSIAMRYPESKEEMHNYLNAINNITAEDFFVWANKQDRYIRESGQIVKEKTLMDLINDFLE